MRYSFYTADVFTDQVFGGNQLAVLPEAQGLTTAQMQRVAREFNYSETVFVLPPETPLPLGGQALPLGGQAGQTCRLRIFTPGAEVPFAGHPTVGTAYVLAAIGVIPLQGEVTRIVFGEGVGPVPVTIRAEGGRPVSAQLTAARLPEFGPPPPPPADMAALLSLDEADLLAGGREIEAASCGLPFLFVPLASRAAVGRARVNRDRWQQVLGGYWTQQVFVFAYDPELPGSDIRARMFAPALGIEEDPATGSAVVTLAGYLARRAAPADGTLRWRIEQGFEMGRPSLLDAEADKVAGAITAVRVGGASVLVSQGTMEVPAVSN